MFPVAMTIAGSDPSGGAGIQADLKTFHQFGVYGQAVLTLLTVQNTQAVSRVEVLDPTLVKEQIEAVYADIPPAAIKTGALGNAGVIEAVSRWLSQSQCKRVVVDPVLISKHGSPLLAAEAHSILKTELIPKACLVTPNIPEAEALTGLRIADEAGMLQAGRQLLELGCGAVLIKGGHREGEPVDLFVDRDGYLRLTGQRIHTRHTHGTGCTLSAAITALLAKGHELRLAVAVAKRYVEKAIASAPGLGSGHGPLNHFADVGPFYD